MSVATELQRLITAKSNIKTAIENKGVTVGNTAFLDSYHTYISQIQTGTVQEWTPPTDWIDISDVANNEINLLIGDFSPYIAFNVTATGGYTVNWGDGTINNYSSGANATHTYTVGAGQSCSRGYTTFKIRIYAQTPANSITNFSVSNGTLQQRYGGLLWAKFGTTGLTSLQSAFYGSYSLPNYSTYLECIELPESLTSCTNFSSFANKCQSLQKAAMPLYYYSGDINFSNIFQDCWALPNIDYRATSLNVSNFSYAHQSNFAIKSINLPPTVNNCTSWEYFAQNCYGLLEFIAPTINTNCSCNYMLEGCRNTLKIDLSGFNNHITSAQYMLQNTSNCDDLTLPTNMPISYGSYLTYMLNGMNKVRVITFPNLTGGITISSVSYMMYAMYNLERVYNFPALNGVTNYGSIFANDNRLKYIDNIDQLGDTTTAIASTIDFNTLYSIESLTLRSLFTRLVAPCGTSTTNRSKLTSLRLTNPNSTFSGSSPQLDMQYTSLSKSAIEQVFWDFPSGLATGKTLRITGSVGTDTLVSKSSSGTTIGSYTITIANTTNLSVGMEVYGIGITDVRSVTFTDATDIVTRTAHGLSNGMRVSFSAITSTTGIVINTIYYVINATTDTFQLSATSGGSAISLTTDGSGSLRVYPKIQAIQTNTNITIDVPCTATGSVTMTVGLLERSIALLKGCTLTN